MARLWRAALAVVAPAVLLSSPAAALSFSNLFVFGDSIVDVGNTQTLVVRIGGADPAPAALGYYDGRFTNGLNPADVLSLAITGANSDNSLAGGTNFAFGGARARNDGGGVPDLAAQVAQFGSSVGGVADPHALYMINVGGNDVFDVIGGGNASAIFDAAATAVATSVLTLQGMGAQHILFVGVGDVGSPPSANGFEAIGRQASIDLNDAILADLPAGVAFFDTIGFFDVVLANPTAYGLPAGLLTEVSCLGGGGAPPSGPPTCDAYAFFDNTHPTTQVLQVLGEGLVAFVPEPGTGLLVAFGTTAIAVRRRAQLSQLSQLAAKSWS